MKEELIRIEHGVFRSDTGEYRFDISVSCGECIGVYVDEYLTSGTAYLDLFKGRLALTDGRAFCCGSKTGAAVIEHWIRQNTMLVDKSRFAGRELTMRDFVLALGRTTSQCGTAEIACRDRYAAAAWAGAFVGDAPCRPFGAGLLPAFGVPRMVHRLSAARPRSDDRGTAPAGSGPADAVRTASARAWHGGAPFRYG